MDGLVINGGRGSSPRVRGKRLELHWGDGRPGLIPARAGKTCPPNAAWTQDSAHPRACGKNGHHPGEPGGEHGSSPRVRGKQRERPLDEPQPGLIPARAGKTKGRCATRASRRAHPRACGENGDVGGPQAGGLGSSPRVRGKPSSRQHRPPRQRLIPARAGKTPCVEVAPGFPRAHPRACGENSPMYVPFRSASGSSPRVRGKRDFGALLPAPARLIPARAGKTAGRPPPSVPHAAHPRACGENRRAKDGSDGPQGSSPRVRGKPWGSPTSRPPPRLIPARAGKTSTRWSLDDIDTAHPRACGENLGGGDGDEGVRGSSPRVRGKHSRGGGADHFSRLIPARAGKTSSAPSHLSTGEAHPRVCGENAPTRAPWHTGRGSSPRVRGKHQQHARAKDHRGLIPACAGKTP